MISNQYKCIFIHIPKTAGTSIEQKLGHFQELKRGVQDHRTIANIEPISLSELLQTGLSMQKGFKSKLKKAFKDRITGFNRCYQDYYKFSFVRNPWARVFSWYKNVMRDVNHKRRYRVADNCTFKEFVDKHMDQGELKPQMYWLRNKKGEVPMDFIGRFENLESDFSLVAGKIGLKDKSLPKLIAGEGQDYAEFYDKDMIHTIAEIYRDEIEYFNFKYGE